MYGMLPLGINKSTSLDLQPLMQKLNCVCLIHHDNKDKIRKMQTPCPRQKRGDWNNVRDAGRGQKVGFAFQRPHAVVVLVCWLVPGCLAADQNRSQDPAEEWYMVLVFSLLFGFFITLFGTAVGYFSYLEDSLLRRYRDEGETITARVVSVEFARAGGRQGLLWGGAGKDDPEYNLFVEYDRHLRDTYLVRIRKQVKARLSDFSTPLPPHTTTPSPKPSGIFQTPPRVAPFVESPKQQQQQHQHQHLNPPQKDWFEQYSLQNTSVSASSLVATHHLLELLVLPGHEKSGFPKNQIHRSCGLRYRLSTVSLIAFDFALAAFCTWLAATSGLDLDIDHRRIGWYAFAAFFLLILLELPCVYLTMHEMFVQALLDEYLENGEYIHLPCDDSTISSKSDMYLSHEPVGLMI